VVDAVQDSKFAAAIAQLGFPPHIAVEAVILQIAKNFFRKILLNPIF
jgi:hypothetical protein